MRYLAALAPLALATSIVTADTTTKQEPYDADLFNEDKRIFFVNAEFLYWLANESGLQYAIKMDKTPNNPTNATGKYQNTDFHWSPGFRAAFGYFNAPHYWDIFAQHTYLRAEGKTDVKAPTSSAQFLNGTWTEPDLTGNTPLQSAKSHIDLNYNVTDFLVSRRFHPNPHLRLNLFGGITTGFLHQHWDISYKDLIGRTSLVRNRWRFDGLGLRLGTKVDWFMGWDLYLTSNASLAVLSGWYKNTSLQKATPTPNTAVNIGDTTYEDHRLTTTGQLFLGPSWQKRFKSVRTELVVGYEFTMWSNLHEVYHSPLTTPSNTKTPWVNSSVLSLQGLTARLTLDF